MNGYKLPVVDVNDYEDLDVSLPTEVSPATRTLSEIMGGLSLGIFFATLASDIVLFIVGVPLLLFCFVGVLVWAFGVVLTVVTSSAGFAFGLFGWCLHWRRPGDAAMAITGTLCNGVALLASGALVAWYFITQAPQ